MPSDRDEDADTGRGPRQGVRHRRRLLRRVRHGHPRHPAPGAGGRLQRRDEDGLDPSSWLRHTPGEGGLQR